MKTLEERFWPKVLKSDGCWEWQAARQNGYGIIGRGGQFGGYQYAHRASWELHNGPIAHGLNVLHRCDNPPCVRPDHLFLGTQRDNSNDMFAKGRGRPGRLVGEAHPMAKLTASDVAYIRERYQPRKGVGDLAREFGIRREHVWQIAHHKVWDVE